MKPRYKIVRNEHGDGRPIVSIFDNETRWKPGGPSVYVGTSVICIDESAADAVVLMLRTVGGDNVHEGSEGHA